MALTKTEKIDELRQYRTGRRIWAKRIITIEEDGNEIIAGHVLITQAQENDWATLDILKAIEPNFADLLEDIAGRLWRGTRA